MKKAVTKALLIAGAIFIMTGFTSDTTFRGMPVQIAKVHINHLSDEEAWKLLDSVQWPK
jgi:hypothetical protein